MAEETGAPPGWEPAIERAFAMSRLLSALFMTSLFLLLGVFFIVLTSRESGFIPPGPAPTTVVFVVWGIVLAEVLAAPVIRDWVAGSVNAMAPGDIARPGGEAGALLTASVTGLALSEFPLLVGFVFGVLAGSTAPMLQGAVLSLGLYAFMWPRRRTWDRWLAGRARTAGIAPPPATGGAGPDGDGPAPPAGPIHPA